MLTYITGAIGTGKTARTLYMVDKLSREVPKGDPPRQVYVNGVKSLKRDDWIEIPDEQMPDVHELPAGSIIVVDEAWRLYPQRSPRIKEPPEVAAYATSRHRGHDFFLISQRVTSVDHFLRGLVNRHIHLERQFGMPAARYWQWERMGKPDDKWDKRDATKGRFVYRQHRKAYEWYESTDLDTHKPKPPWMRLAMIPGLLALSVAGLLWAYSRITGDKPPDMVDGDVADTPVIAGERARPREDVHTTPVSLTEAEAWARPWKERVPGHPYTAPAYDELYQPRTFPRISGCLEMQYGSEITCICNTQQGTKIRGMDLQTCRDYVRNGWFDPTQEKTDNDYSTGSAGPNSASTMSEANPLNAFFESES